MIFDISKFPDEEREHVSRIESSIQGLQRYADNFGAAVHLRLFCIRNRNVLPHQALFMLWPTMAGRDGAMTLYHFDETLTGIVSSLDLTPTLMTNVDHKQLRLIRKLFNSRFPDPQNFRHAVAHQAELTADRRSFERNAFTGKVSNRLFHAPDGVQNLMVVDAFEGDKFTASHEGRLLNYELSLQSHKKLVDITDRVIGTFKALRDPSLTLHALWR